MIDYVVIIINANQKFKGIFLINKTIWRKNIQQYYIL